MTRILLKKPAQKITNTYLVNFHAFASRTISWLQNPPAAPFLPMKVIWDNNKQDPCHIIRHLYKLLYLHETRKPVLALKYCYPSNRYMV